MYFAQLYIYTYKIDILFFFDMSAGGMETGGMDAKEFSL